MIAANLKLTYIFFPIHFGFINILILVFFFFSFLNMCVCMFVCFCFYFSLANMNDSQIFLLLLLLIFVSVFVVVSIENSLFGLNCVRILVYVVYCCHRYPTTYYNILHTFEVSSVKSFKLINRCDFLKSIENNEFRFFFVFFIFLPIYKYFIGWHKW